MTLYEEMLPNIAGENFNYYELYFERILCKFPEFERMWELYTEHADLCKLTAARARVYKQASKNCRQRSNFKIFLLRENEKNGMDIAEYESILSNR